MKQPLPTTTGHTDTRPPGWASPRSTLVEEALVAPALLATVVVLLWVVTTPVVALSTLVAVALATSVTRQTLALAL